jgi:hypothetical protein
MSNVEDSEAINVRRAVGIANGLRAELSRIPEADLLHPNVDAVGVLTLIRKVLHGLADLRPEIQQLPRFDVGNLERLELLAMGFLGAQAQYATIKERNKEPSALVAEGVALRARLLSDAKALVRRGLLAADPLNDLRGGRGYKQVAADLLLLATLLETRFGALAGKCATTQEELARAEALADRLIGVASENREPRKAEAEALETRMRAFTLFFRAYCQVRRAVQYLRFDEGDADQLAPSLTGNRKSRQARKTRKPRKNDTDQTNALSHAPSVALDTANDAAGRSALVNQPNGSVVSSPNERGMVAEAAVNSTGIGLPGSDPFLN